MSAGSSGGHCIQKFFKKNPPIYNCYFEPVKKKKKGKFDPHGD